MALRAYINSGLQLRNVLRDPGIRVTREIDGYSSRAEFRMVLPNDAVRPQIGQHVVIRDDRQLLRNSNRFANAASNDFEWRRTQMASIVSSWGPTPEETGDNLGVRWALTSSNAANGRLEHRVPLVEYRRRGVTGAIMPVSEKRTFVHSWFIEKGSVECTLRALAAPRNSTSAQYAAQIIFNASDGSWTVASNPSSPTPQASPGVQVIDLGDWWRVGIVSVMQPQGSSDSMPYVLSSLYPRNDTITTCCWQISEIAPIDPAEFVPFSWDELDAPWESLDLTWDEAGDLAEAIFPSYYDRREVSANVFLGLVAELKVTKAGPHHVFVDVFSIDYKAKFRKTLITATYSNRSDEYILAQLFSVGIGSPLTLPAPYLRLFDAAPNTNGLSFSWENTPLDQVLDQICAQTGRAWRIHPEAWLHYAPPSLEAVDYTFGDGHNLINNSRNLDGSQWQGAASVTLTRRAVPTGGIDNAWEVEDTSASVTQDIYQAVPSSGKQDTAPHTIVYTPVATRVYLLKGSATHRYVRVGMPTLCIVDCDTGDYRLFTGETGTFPLVKDAGGDDWIEVQIVGSVNSSTGYVNFSIAPCYGNGLLLTDEDATLMGSAVVWNPQVCRGTLARPLATDDFVAYVNHDCLTALVAGEESIADLANVITVQSDEAGTYSYTAEDADSIATYGRFEVVITDSEMPDDDACERRANAELALKAWPRVAHSLKCRGCENLDVGMRAVVAHKQLLQTPAASQMIQRMQIAYRGERDMEISLTCASFLDYRITEALRR